MRDIAGDLVLDMRSMERQHDFHVLSTSEHDIVQVILELANLAPPAMGKCSPL